MVEQLKQSYLQEVNENKVLLYYEQLVKNEKITFLKGRKRHADLVLRGVEVLRKSEDMHSRIQAAKDLWKVLFEAAMTYIDPDKSGYDDLFSYFDKFVEFEELIFASDSFYRDHTLHVLWVYFLGEYIYFEDQYERMLAPYQTDMESIMHFFDFFDKVTDGKMGKQACKVRDGVAKRMLNKCAVRCLTTLTHDLGYPVKKVSKINHAIKTVLPYFGLHTYDEFEFHYSTEQKKFIEGFLTVMSLSIQIKLEQEDETEVEALLASFAEHGKLDFKTLMDYEFSENEKEMLSKNMESSYLIQPTHKKMMEQSKNFETFQHGILSAYLLMRHLPAFSSLNWIYSDKPNTVFPNSVEIDQLFSKVDILGAISNHTSDTYRITSIDDASAYLTLMDELEEFSRISRANQSRSYVEEFCRTALGMTEDGWFEIVFVFDNDSIDGLDPERAFKGRCRRFLSLFDIQNMSDDLKIRLKCVGDLPYDQSEYMLEVARNFGRIVIDGEEKHIPKYLKSSEFYTTEEYISMGEEQADILVEQSV